jgi:FtsH-binding integral membrane protein
MALSGFAITVYLPFFILFRPADDSRKGLAMTIGTVAASVLNLGITFKFQHWPGASVMIVLGIVAFAFLFIPMLLREKLKNEGSERRTFMNTCGATGLTLFSSGLLFKLMHWPGASVMLALSILFLFFGYFLLYMLDKTIDSEVKSVYLRKAFFSIIIGSIVATCLLLDLSRPWFKNTPVQTASVIK